MIASVNAGNPELWVSGDGINKAFSLAIKQTDPTIEDLHLAFYFEILKNMYSNTSYTLNDFKNKNPEVFKEISKFTNSESLKIKGTLLKYEKLQQQDYFENMYMYISEIPIDEKYRFTNENKYNYNNGNIPGDIIIDIFKSTFNLEGKFNPLNKAMIYCVGPAGKGKEYLDENHVTTSYQIGTAKEFINAIHKIGVNIATAINLYNKEAIRKIDYVRIPLISGNLFGHPKVSTISIAKSLMQGILTIDNSEVEFNFAYVHPDNNTDSEGVFEKAYKEIKSPI